MAALTKLITYINLEMSGDTKRYLVSVKQGDKATRFIIAKLLNNGEAYTIPTGSRVVINIAKPDGKHVYNTCTYSGSDVTVELTNQALAASGTAYCDIEIRTSDDSQVITSASFTMEIEPSQRNDNAILSANEFTELENRVKGHIESIDSTNEAVKKAEQARVTAENARVKAEQARATAENNRQQNENTRIQQEQQRQQDTSQAVKNTNDATDESKRATTACKEVTERAEDALQNQEQLEATLNTATQIRQDVSQMQTAVQSIAERRTNMTDWKKVTGTQSDKPEEVDRTSSPSTVYLRKNIEQVTREVEGSDGKMQTVTEWQYDEKEMTVKEYENMTLMKSVVEENTSGIVESVTQFQKDAVIDEYTQQLIEEGLI